MTKLFEVEIIGKVCVLRKHDEEEPVGPPIVAGSPREVGLALAAYLKTVLTPEAKA